MPIFSTVVLYHSNETFSLLLYACYSEASIWFYDGAVWKNFTAGAFNKSKAS